MLHQCDTKGLFNEGEAHIVTESFGLHKVNCTCSLSISAFFSVVKRHPEYE